jgi:probable rRNA maturation factor
LDGEIVVSAETAASSCAEHGTTPENELLLYVVHGALHLVGYDDRDDASRAEMRRREREVLAEVNSQE